MRTLEVKIKRESDRSRREAGRYNPASVAIWEQPHRGSNFSSRHRLILSAGDDDSIYVWEHAGVDVIVLSLNRSLGYAGVQVYDQSTGEQTGELFLQADHEIEDVLGKRGVDLEPLTIARRLYMRVCELCC